MLEKNEWQPEWALVWRWMWVAPWKFPGQSWDDDCSVWMGSGLQRPEGGALESPSQEEQGWAEGTRQWGQVGGVAPAPIAH